ncbi:hypothetical protein AA0117_g12576 [Alternaria alternata]|jgi:hypothetical protein|uniref:J domain-containing protein n=1 Tax=Alternaria alternata TaxID=5599 RepID=A0A4Q4MYV4_ALTAL|nr:hypothetical protein AA0117_g12576 [Alternaria alternata]
MVTPAEEEQLRESYYICCRNEGCTINEASERSLEYIKRIHNAEMSLTTTAYLEEVFQNSRSRPRYSSTPLSYEDNLFRHVECLSGSRFRNSHGSFDHISEMRDGIPSFFGGTREQHEQNRSGPGLRAPEYIPSPYDYRNNAPELQGRFCGYLQSHNRPVPPHQSSYRPRTHPPHESYYTTEDRQPPSAYDSYASASTYSSYPPVPDNFEPYASPDSRTTDSRPSFCSGARPSVFYTRRQPPPPRFTFYSAFESSNNSRDRTPPSYPYTGRPSSPCRPVPPRPEGAQPTTDLYNVLGVTRNATAAEIRKAHRALSLRWHSDRRTEQEQKEATEKMAEINQANDVLCNEVERRFYDRWGVLPNEE